MGSHVEVWGDAVVTKSSWIVRIYGDGNMHMVEGNGWVLSQIIDEIQKLVGKRTDLNTNLLVSDLRNQITMLK